VVEQLWMDLTQVSSWMTVLLALGFVHERVKGARKACSRNCGSKARSLLKWVVRDIALPIEWLGCSCFYSRACCLGREGGGKHLQTARLKGLATWLWAPRSEVAHPIQSRVSSAVLLLCCLPFFLGAKRGLGRRGGLFGTRTVRLVAALGAALSQREGSSNVSEAGLIVVSPVPRQRVVSWSFR